MMLTEALAFAQRLRCSHPSITRDTAPLTLQGHPAALHRPVVILVGKLAAVTAVVIEAVLLCGIEIVEIVAEEELAQLLAHPVVILEASPLQPSARISTVDVTGRQAEAALADEATEVNVVEAHLPGLDVS